MILKDKYPKLWNFFGAYFPDADLDNLTDEEVVQDYLKIWSKSPNSTKELQSVKKELDDLILNIELWKEVGFEANRHFENSEDAVNWMKMIKEELNKDITK